MCGLPQLDPPQSMTKAAISRVPDFGKAPRPARDKDISLIRHLIGTTMHLFTDMQKCISVAHPQSGLPDMVRCAHLHVLGKGREASYRHEREEGHYEEQQGGAGVRVLIRLAQAQVHRAHHDAQHDEPASRGGTVSGLKRIVVSGSICEPDPGGVDQIWV